MDIHISKESHVPLHEQISGQLVFLIATRRLQPGEKLPSIKALARKLKVHHNTVSEAVKYLVKWDLVVRRRGARLVVNDPGSAAMPIGQRDLDDLINDFIKSAQAQGFRDQEILRRVRERLLAQPPNHILALSFDAGMRRLFEAELRAAFPWLIRSCSPDELIANPEISIGALVITPPGVLPRVVSVLPKTRTALSIVYSEASRHLEVIAQLPDPSIIALASVSEAFLKTARGLLGPVTSGRHSLIEYLMPENGSPALPTADIILCDILTASILGKRARARKVFPYRLIAPRCLEQIAAIMPAQPPADVENVDAGAKSVAILRRS